MTEPQHNETREHNTMRVYAYHNKETDSIRYSLDKRAARYNETEGDSLPVLPASNWEWDDDIDYLCVVWEEYCIPIRFPGFNHWYIAGNECGAMLAIFADSWEDAYEEFLDYLGTLPGYQGETPDSEDAEHGTYDGNGNWFSECTLAYLWMKEAMPETIGIAFDPSN